MISPDGTKIAFRRYAEIRFTYLQTVRALSRVPEVGGYVETGHSRRVSQLARSVGAELGMAAAKGLQMLDGGDHNSLRTTHAHIDQLTIEFFTQHLAQ